MASLPSNISTASLKNLKLEIYLKRHASLHLQTISKINHNLPLPEDFKMRRIMGFSLQSRKEGRSIIAFIIQISS